MAAAGDVLQDRYELRSLIATGGMGEVWRAQDRVLGREVAAKVLKSEFTGDPVFLTRFRTEARLSAGLTHPNVAVLHDYGEVEPASPGGDRLVYLVMELVDGEPLSALLRGGERMPPDTASDLLAQAADGIAAAHALGIVHRDVKPANLLVTPDGTVKITDFGIARAGGAVALTQTGQVIGTPQYLSPEQAEGKPSTEASDIYSLGVVLYECLAGRRPFDGDTAIATALSHLRDEPPALPGDIPTHLRETVRVALSKDPAARFASAHDFATALHGGPIRGGAGTPQGTGSDDPTLVAGAAGAPVASAAAAAAAARGHDDGTRVLTDAAGPGATAAPPRTPPPTTPSAPSDDRRRRTPGWLPWVAAALAVLLVLFVIAQLADDRSGDSTADDPTDGPSSAAPSSEQSSPSTKPEPSKKASPSATPEEEPVVVDPDDYIGRPAKDARKDLEKLGLTVDERTVENPDGAEPGTVADVSPSGEVDPDQTVTLSVYDEPPVVETPSVPDPGEGTDPGSDPGAENGNDKKPKDKKQ